MPHYITLHLRHDSIIKCGLGTYCLTLSARSIMLLNDNKDQLLLIGLRGIIRKPMPLQSIVYYFSRSII